MLVVISHLGFTASPSLVLWPDRSKRQAGRDSTAQLSLFLSLGFIVGPDFVFSPGRTRRRTEAIGANDSSFRS